MSRADDLADIESGLLALRGMNNAAITAAKVLTDSETGFLLLDASAGGFPLTLPASNRPMEVLVQRADNTGNRLVVQAAAGEKILFHTHLRPAGYPFFVLMGSGDYWHLRSDSNGSWRVLNRLDNTPVGRPVMETTTAINPGGWGLYHGLIYNRADWPWMWDHAQASGMLTTEALRAGKEGMWTDGDGLLTFRTPEGRGEFARFLDEGRGVDAGRAAGSWQKGTMVTADTSGNGDGSVVTGLGGNAATPLANFGIDAITLADYPPQLHSVQAGFVNTTTTAFVGSTRPRNIAYPGRLKLI